MIGNTKPDSSGVDYWISVNDDGKTRAVEGYIAAVQADEAANDSDKKITVPADTAWIIQSIWVELITTADVGDRQLVIEIQDASDDVVAQFRAGAVQAESLTRYYMFAPQLVGMDAFIDTDYLTTPIPPLMLPAGYDVRIYDNAAIAAAADDMVVQMMVKPSTTTT